MRIGNYLIDHENVTICNQRRIIERKMYFFNKKQTSGWTGNTESTIICDRLIRHVIPVTEHTASGYSDYHEWIKDWIMQVSNNFIGTKGAMRDTIPIYFGRFITQLIDVIFNIKYIIYNWCRVKGERWSQHCHGDLCITISPHHGSNGNEAFFQWLHKWRDASKDLFIVVLMVKGHCVSYRLREH